MTDEIAERDDEPPPKDDDDYETYPNTVAGWAERWAAEFAYADEFHRKWLTAGKETVGKFLMRDIKTNDPQAPGYNMGYLWANVKTMTDMLYGRIPQVSVDRRWADPEDQVSRVASEMASRLLNADIEEAGEDFSTVLRNCLQDRLLPGLGCVRVRYDLSEKDQSDDHGDTRKVKEDEWLEDIYVPWPDVIWSPARFWKEIRWIAFRTYKSKKELRQFLGKDAKELDFQSIPFNSKSPMEQLSSKTHTIWNKAEVWEIWSREFGQVFWWVKGFPKILKSVEDPLGLDGFFPCPPFFIANTTTMEYVPKSDYSFAEALYKEIDLLSERISLLTKAVKVIGVYDKKAGPEIARLVNETAENKLIPVDSWAVFAERGGIKGSIEFLPLDQIILALEKLQEQRQDRENALYQITGMSDILRGAAQDAQTQVGTQQLKARFASIRVQAVQDAFTQFAVDHQKIRLEIFCKVFDDAQLIARSNMGAGPDQLLLPQAIQLLRNTDISRWRIMIQPESMALIDYSQLRMERTEYINALGIFLQSSFPIAEKFPEAAPILMELLKWGLAGFKGSKQIEGVIDRAMAAMAPKPGQPPPGQGQPNPEVVKQQMEMQHSVQEHQQKMQEMAQTHSLKLQEMDKKFEIKMREMEIKLEEMEAKRGDREHAQAMKQAQSNTKVAEAQSLAALEPAAGPPPLGLGQAPPPINPMGQPNGLQTQ